MGLYAICTGYIQDTFRDGEKIVSQSKVRSAGNDYSPMNCFAPGIEINPANGEFLIVEKLNNSDSFMVTTGGINQNITPTTLRGERKIYSVSEDGKLIKASIYFKNNGILELNGNTKTLVTGAELQSALTTSDGLLNTELGKIAVVLNSLVPGSYTVTPVVTTITQALTTTLKTNG